MLSLTRPSASIATIDTVYVPAAKFEYSHVQLTVPLQTIVLPSKVAFTAETVPSKSYALPEIVAFFSVTTV